MTATLTLTAAQVAELRPVLGLQGTRVLVAAVHPNGADWQLDVHALPSERRDSIRAACSGQLKLPKSRKPKPLSLPRLAPAAAPSPSPTTLHTDPPTP